MENKAKQRVNMAFIKTLSRQVFNQLKENDNYKDITEQDVDSIIFDTEGQLSNEVASTIRLMIKAMIYLDTVNVPHMCERLREGFIGKIIKNKDGTTSIQNKRGNPYGTLVAVPTKDGNTVIGISYVEPTERFSSPIIGEYLALKRAVERFKSGEIGAENKCIRSKAKAQVEHFYKRSLAYFNPDKYSFSRGTEPVKYTDYEEIHSRQQMILGEEKMKEMATKPANPNRTDFTKYGNVKTMTFKGTLKSYNELASIDFNSVPDRGYYIWASDIPYVLENSKEHPTKSDLKLEPGAWLIKENNYWTV